MKFIIQQNGLGVNEFDTFINIMWKINVDYQIVKVVPFSHEITPEVIETGKEIIPFGTIFLSEIGRERGWQIFHNDNFDQRIWTEKYKGHTMPISIERSLI